MTLLLEMFASNANVLLCTEEGAVIDAFLNRTETVGMVRAIPSSQEEITVASLFPNEEAFASAILSQFAQTNECMRALKSAAPKLGTRLASEVLVRTGVPRDRCTPDDAARLARTAVTLCSGLLYHGPISPLIYYDDKEPVCFSLLPLEQCAGLRSESFPDLFAGIRRFISTERSAHSLRQKRGELTAWIRKELAKTNRTIAAVEQELTEASRGERYQHYAQLILNSLGTVTKGVASFDAQDPSEPGRIITVPLDPSLAPQKNAERYFEKAKKARAARIETEERLLFLRKKSVSFSELAALAESVTDSIAFKRLLAEQRETLTSLGYMTEQEQQELPPFKIFQVEGGFTVYAGKNSENNDLLTFRFAKPNDLWFHARGSSGSHVVLKVGTGHGEPTKKAVEQAASIAAYYSKMKNAKHVPVAVTERKFIRKPKGAPAGTVALDKEKVIFVQPVLPEPKA